MKGGKDVRERNVGNKEEEGLEENGNKREWMLVKEREQNRREGRGKGRDG